MSCLAAEALGAVGTVDCVSVSQKVPEKCVARTKVRQMETRAGHGNKRQRSLPPLTHPHPWLLISL